MGESGAGKATETPGAGQELPLGVNKIGDLVPGVLDRGKRTAGGVRRARERRTPTNSVRLNRALAELGPSAFKVHMLLWKWRGAPADGLLPFFTLRGLSPFCNLTRPTVRSAIRELVSKGWIERLGYNVHEKNELYRLAPIVKVPRNEGRGRGVGD